jgi:serine/threonine protein kinase
MHYLHSQHSPVLHRDLKASNVLVHKIGMDQWNVKIADFGLSLTNLHKNLHLGLGAVDHRAPEATIHKYTPKCDVFR